jgi:hypothetical protein
MTTNDEKVVIRILGLRPGETTGFDGEFVVEYDPGRPGIEPGTNRPMLCYLKTTPDQAMATRYTKPQAIELLLRVDPENPVRADGKPNRPLTAFTVETLPADGTPMCPLLKDL